MDAAPTPLEEPVEEDVLPPVPLVLVVVEGDVPVAVPPLPESPPSTIAVPPHAAEAAMVATKGRESRGMSQG